MLLFWITSKILHLKIPINLITCSHLMHWLFSCIFQKILALSHLWWRRARDPHNFLILRTFFFHAAFLNTKTLAYAVMELLSKSGIELGNSMCSSCPCSHSDQGWLLLMAGKPGLSVPSKRCNRVAIQGKHTQEVLQVCLFWAWWWQAH